MATTWRDLLRTGLRAVARAARAGTRPRSGSRTRALPRPSGHVALPDFPRRVMPVYAPRLDGDADPGEVVWTWVPYEDDPSQGKDRPVLVIGHDEPYLLGLMLTSKDHTRSAAAEARRGRHWMDIGSGDWDAQHRPSEVRLDRVLRIDPGAVRREGAIMPKAVFDAVAASLAEVKGW